MIVRFLEIAEIELDEAVHWYEAQAPGVGDAFPIEVLSAAERIARFPEAWHPLGEGIRRCRLGRFPYGLIYTIHNGDVLIWPTAMGRWRRLPACCSALPRSLCLAAIVEIGGAFEGMRLLRPPTLREAAEECDKRRNPELTAMVAMPLAQLAYSGDRRCCPQRFHSDRLQRRKRLCLTP